MSVIDKSTKKQLIEDGFLPFEIHAMMNAKTSSGAKQSTIPINGKAWGAVRRSRIKYIVDLKRNGWSGDEIKVKISQFYRGKNKSAAVFQWLKMEYKPARKVVDFQAAVQRRAYKHGRVSDDYQKALARKEITHTMGYPYGRRLRRVVVAHRLPVRRIIRKIVRKVE